VSWTTYKTKITTVLTSLGYREIPENKTAEETALSHNHNSYYLNYGGVGDNARLTNKGMLIAHRAVMEIKYKNINSDERANNADSFYTLISEFSKMDNFLGFEETSFDNIDNKHSIGRITFLIGVDGVC